MAGILALSGVRTVHLLVFDVGGSHVSGARFDLPTSSLRRKFSVALESSCTAEEFFLAFRTIAEKLTVAGENPRPAGISVAFPSPFDYEHGVSYLLHKYASLHSISVRDRLAEMFAIPSRQVRFINDADAFLLGELAAPGAPASATRRSIGITLGSGIGSAFAIGTNLIHSGEGVPKDGELWCVPWGSGTVEDAISTRAIQHKYEAKTGRVLQVKDIAESAATDVDSRDTFEEFGRELGTVLRSVCSTFRPDQIILGGAISKSSPLFLGEVKNAIASSVQIRVSHYLDDAPLVGAAKHWTEQEKKTEQSILTN